jgi:sensor histidine kinase YesM
MRPWFKILFILALYSSDVQSQLMPYTQYTLKDGLPSTNIYSITQDNDGFIWLGTDNGLCRFDGYEFLTVEESYKASPSEITSIIIQDTIVYSATYKSEISLFNIKGNFLNNLENPNRLSSYDYLLNYSKYLIILNKGYNVLIFNLETNRFDFVDNSIHSDSSSFPLSMELFNDKLLIGSTKGLFEVDLSKEKLILNPIEIPLPGISYIKSRNDSTVFLASKNSIYSYNYSNKKIDLIFKFENSYARFKQIVIKNESLIYVLTSYPTDLYSIKLDRHPTVLKLNIEYSLYVNYIFIDNDEILWIGTKQNGLFKVNTNAFSRYYKLEAPPITINKIIPLTNENYLISSSNGLYNFDGSNFGSLKFDEQKQEFIRDITINKNNLVISIIDPTITNGVDKFIKQSFGKYNLLFIPSSTGSYLNDSLILLGNWQSGFSYSELEYKSNVIRSIARIKYDSFDRNRTNQIKVTNDYIYASSQSGLFRIDKANSIKKLSGFASKEIREFKDSSLIVVQNTGFVQILDNKIINLSIPNILQLSELKLQTIDKDKQNNWWIGTNNGIYITKGSASNTFHIGKNDGFPSSNISFLMFDRKNNQVVACANEYLIFIDIDNLHFDSKNKDVKLISIISKYSEFDYFNSLKLRYFDRQFMLKFVTLNLTNPYAVTYKYKVDGNDWVVTKKREVAFYNLDYGNHKIQVKSSIYGGSWGPPSTVSLYIKPPFWHSTIFYLLSLFGLITFIFYSINSRYGSLKITSKQYLESKYQLVDLKLRINANNLSPHFVYNALNSIKDYIKNHPLSYSLDYIDKFSKLVRINLSNSTEISIRMEDDIERLSNYVEIEKLRSKVPFEFHIKISKGIDPKITFIPNMVIQPFVENCIWYGFQPPLSKGNITLSFTKNKEEIKIIIEDDGIGIDEAKKLKIKAHESKGTELVYSRFKSLDPFCPDAVTLTEAFPGQKFPGTKVTLRLTPKMIAKLITR